MRKVIIKGFAGVIAIVIVSVLLVGCSGFSILSTETNELNAIKKSYFSSNEKEEREIRVAEGETCIVSFDIVTNKGVINISIINEEGVSFYTGNDITTSTFEETLDKEGVYTLKIETKQHSGSYDIKWIH